MPSDDVAGFDVGAQPRSSRRRAAGDRGAVGGEVHPGGLRHRGRRQVGGVATRSPASPDGATPHRQHRAAVKSSTAAPAGRPCGPQKRSPAPPPARTHHDPRARGPRLRGPRRPRVRRRRPRPARGRRHHLPQNLGGLALPLRRPGRLLAPDRWLEHGRPHARRARGSTRSRWRSITAGPAPGLIHHSDQGSQYVSLAFGQTARAAGIAQSMESSRRLLRQRRRRELLRHPEERARQPPAVADQSRATQRDLRLHRDLLQPPTTPRNARHDLARGLREQHSRPRRSRPRRFAARVPPENEIHCTNRNCTRLTNPCPPKRGKSTRPAHSTTHAPKGRHPLPPRGPLHPLPQTPPPPPPRAQPTPSRPRSRRRLPRPEARHRTRQPPVPHHPPSLRTRPRPRRRPPQSGVLDASHHRPPPQGATSQRGPTALDILNRR